MVHPVPAGFTGTMDEMCQHVARYPDRVLGVVVLAWSATTFVSTWIATRLGNRLAGIAVVLILSSAIVFNVSKLPYATWFKVVMLRFRCRVFFGSRAQDYRCPLPRRLQKRPAGGSRGVITRAGTPVPSCSGRRWNGRAAFDYSNAPIGRRCGASSSPFKRSCRERFSDRPARLC